MSNNLIKFPAKNKENRKQRAKFGVSNQDWWSANSYLTVVIHNLLYRLATENNGHPANKNTEEWHDELMHIVSRLKWLHNYDSIDMDMYEMYASKLDFTYFTIEYVGHPITEDEEYYHKTLFPALEERRQQIIEEVFTWVGKNFDYLWD